MDVDDGRSGGGGRNGTKRRGDVQLGEDGPDDDDDGERMIRVYRRDRTTGTMELVPEDDYDLVYYDDVDTDDIEGGREDNRTMIGRDGNAVEDGLVAMTTAMEVDDNGGDGREGEGGGDGH